MTTGHARKLFSGTLIYIVRDGKVLLLQRVKKQNDTHEGKYVGLGGKLEPGESPLECAVREVKEESGLDISPEHMKFKGHVFCPEFDRNGNDWMVYVYLATDFKGTLIRDCAEGELEWVSWEHLKSVPMWEGDYLFLEHMFSDHTFDMTVRYEGNELTEHRLILL